MEKKVKKKLAKLGYFLTIWTMKFVLIDKIVSLESGKEIKAVKSVSLA